MVLKFRFCGLLFLLGVMVSPFAEAQIGPPVDDRPDEVRHARIRELIPRSYSKLSARKAIHAVAIGDSITRYKSYDEFQNNTHKAWHGVFLAELAKEFFFTGGVRDVRPRAENGAKLDPTRGPELTMENLGMSGRTVLHALSRLTTDALVSKPDLVLINFGINDVFTGVSLDNFSRALEEAVQMCKRRRIDVVLAGPSVLYADDLGQTSATRPYGEAMRMVAERNQAFYFDLGSPMLSSRGMSDAKDGAEVMERVVRNLRVHFDHGPENDDPIHPNELAHRQMGRQMFRALLNGVEPLYRMTGATTLDGAGRMMLEFKIKNLVDEPRSGHLVLLNAGGMVPEVRTLPFEVKASKGKTYKVAYAPATPDTNYTMPGNAQTMTFPMIVSDDEVTKPVDFQAVVLPVTVIWDYALRVDQEGMTEVRAEIVNRGMGSISGSYTAEWSGQQTSGNFQSLAGGKSPISLRFNLPKEGGYRLRDSLMLKVKAGGQTLAFKRGLEATRYLANGKGVPMGSSEANQGGVQMSTKVTASQTALAFTVDLEGYTVPTSENPWMTVEIGVDGRQPGARRRFGFVDALRVTLIGGKAPKVGPLRWASFGNGYDRALDAAAVKCWTAKTAGGGQRLTLTIPRNYFYLHEWGVGNPKSTLGVNVSAQLMDPKGDSATNLYPRELSYWLAGPGMSKFNAESLATLELASVASSKWSVRLY